MSFPGMNFKEIADVGKKSFEFPKELKSKPMFDKELPIKGEEKSSELYETSNTRETTLSEEKSIGLTNDCIHRCTDIMGHIGEEFRLGAACVFRCPVRFLQCLMGFDLGLFLLRHIHRAQQCFDQLCAIPLQRNEGNDLIGVLIHGAVFKFVDVVLALQISADIFRRDYSIQCVQRFQCLKP